MKTTALILGIIGGIFGLIGSAFAMFVGGLAESFAGDPDNIIGLSLIALLLSVSGIVGGSIARVNPKIAGIIMLISGIGGFICISMGYIIAGPLLILGGIFALVSSKHQ